MKASSPVKVIKGFLPKEQRLPLFKALEGGPWHTLSLRYGNTAKRRNIVFYEGDPEAAYAYTKKATDKDRPIRYADGPPELRAVRRRLQDEYGFSFSLCYVNLYGDESVGIGWHNDAEEVGSQIPVRMICLGGSRVFSIWKVRRDKDGKLQEPKADWEELTESGDLVEMPVGFHEEEAYRHAVLPQSQFAAARISLTFRSPDLSSTGPWAPRRPAPGIYQPEFLSPAEAQELLAASAALPRKRGKVRPWGQPRRNVLGQNFLDVPSKRIQYVARDLPPKPIAEAPAPVRHMIEKLQQLAGRTVNYASLVIYENENDHMGWHQHKEDKGHDTPVFIVPVGAERTFGIREKGKPETTITFTAKSGSLITLPSEYNDTHEHAVLKDKGPKGERLAWNCKCIDEIYNPQPKGPRVFCCKAGHEYPVDAVYVGCRTVRGKSPRAGSIFGNAADPLKVRHEKSNPWIAATDKEFREYAVQRLRDDPAFRAEAEKLKGKHLLCWCEQEGPKRAQFCHARVWLELANESPTVPGRVAVETTAEDSSEPHADGQRD